MVKFYWLIPITSSEVMFKKAYGLEALEIKLDQSGFDYVNPLRKKVWYDVVELD
ncbi:suppressor of fused domain protein [Novosphingobium colocasiae]